MLQSHVYSIRDPNEANIILLGQTSKIAREEKTGFVLNSDNRYPTLLNGKIFKEKHGGYYTFRFSSKDLITISFLDKLKTFLGTNQIIKSK